MGIRCRALSPLKSALHWRWMVTESTKSKNDAPLESSIPYGEVSLESILCTEKLRRRPWRAPDHLKGKSRTRGAGQCTSRLTAHYSSDSRRNNPRGHPVRLIRRQSIDCRWEKILLASHRRHLETAHWRRDPARIRSVRRRARS